MSSGSYTLSTAVRQQPPHSLTNTNQQLHSASHQITPQMYANAPTLPQAQRLQQHGNLAGIAPVPAQNMYAYNNRNLTTHSAHANAASTSNYNSSSSSYSNKSMTSTSAAQVLTSGLISSSSNTYQPHAVTQPLTTHISSTNPPQQNMTQTQTFQPQISTLQPVYRTPTSLPQTQTHAHQNMAQSHTMSSTNQPQVLPSTPLAKTATNVHQSAPVQQYASSQPLTQTQIQTQIQTQQYQKVISTQNTTSTVTHHHPHTAPIAHQQHTAANVQQVHNNTAYAHQPLAHAGMAQHQKTQIQTQSPAAMLSSQTHRHAAPQEYSIPQTHAQQGMNMQVKQEYKNSNLNVHAPVSSAAQAQAGVHMQVKKEHSSNSSSNSHVHTHANSTYQVQSNTTEYNSAYNSTAVCGADVHAQHAITTTQTPTPTPIQTQTQAQAQAQAQNQTQTQQAAHVSTTTASVYSCTGAHHTFTDTIAGGTDSDSGMRHEPSLPHSVSTSQEAAEHKEFVPFSGYYLSTDAQEAESRCVFCFV
jgi:hypothetical protein